MSLELLRQVSLSLLQVIRFFTARHARPGRRSIYLPDEGSAKFKWFIRAKWKIQEVPYKPYEATNEAE